MNTERLELIGPQAAAAAGMAGTQRAEADIGRILRLADLMDELPDGKFDMNSWGYERDQPPQYHESSPACVGAWAIRTFGNPQAARQIYRNRRKGDGTIARYAQGLLGIGERNAARLFRVHSWRDHNASLTTRDAARVLREFTSTGQVQWPDRRPLADRILKPTLLTNLIDLILTPDPRPEPTTR